MPLESGDGVGVDWGRGVAGPVESAAVGACGDGAWGVQVGDGAGVGDSG